MNKQYDISNYMGMIAPPISTEAVIEAAVATYHKNLVTTPESCIDSLKIDLADKVLEMAK